MAVDRSADGGTEGRAAGLALLALTPLLLITVLLCAALPIYTDELMSKVLFSRLLIDGFREIRNFLPLCGEPLVAPPIFAVPYRLLDVLLYQDRSMLWLRCCGLVLGAGWLVTATALTRRLYGAVDWRTAMLVAAALATLGVLPFHLVINRPEQPLLLVCTFSLLMPMLAAQASPRRRAVLILSLVVGAGWMFASHAKGVIFAPLPIVAIWLLARPRWWRLAIVPILLMAIESHANWVDRFSCPDYPTMLQQERLRHTALTLRTMGPWEYIRLMTDRFLSDPLSALYIEPVLLKDNYTSDWLLPSVGLTPLEWAADGLIVIAFAALLALSMVAAWKLIAARRRGTAMPAGAAMLAVLALCWLGLAAAQPKHNDYESALMVPLLIVLAMAAIGLARRGGHSLRRWQVRTAAGVVLLASIVSQTAVLFRVGHSAATDWLAGGYLPDQDVSFSSFHGARVGDQVVAAAAMCGIRPSATPRHLLVDELTYGPFAASREPFFMTYVTGGWGEGIADLEQLLRDRRSAGIVAGCHRLPPALAARAKQSGPYCCVEAFD